jgi:hypothetical protein
MQCIGQSCGIDWRRALAACTVSALTGALVACGGSTKTVTAPARTVTVPSTGTTTMPAPARTQPNAPPTASPSVADAQRFAHRTYVVQPSAGKRVFEVNGPAARVTAADGSLISAFAMVLADSGDGTGQAVLLFRGRRFLGWASDHMAVRLSVSAAARDVAVKYGAFRGKDPLCCPSSTKTVDYSWNGSRIVADGDPPLVYGKRGDQLHLSP